MFFVVMGPEIGYGDLVEWQLGQHVNPCSASAIGRCLDEGGFLVDFDFDFEVRWPMVGVRYIL
jgi:hypothetical protein